MPSDEFLQVKASIRQALDDLKSEPALQKYLEDHLVFNEQDETVCYTGEKDAVNMQRDGSGYVTFTWNPSIINPQKQKTTGFVGRVLRSIRPNPRNS